MTPRSAAAQRPSAGKSPELERALALRDVMDHAVRVQREITAPKRLGNSRARTIVLGFVFAAALGAGAYSWVARPEFIWGPHPTESAGHVIASTRVTMAIIAARVEAYRRADAALPPSLAAINEDAPGITYQVLSDTSFELRTLVGATELVLRSTDSVDDFLGSSLNVVSTRAP